MKTADENMLVTVVVSTYNGEKYLAVQLDSIVGQTHKNLEIIISDDASSDKTLEIAQRYAANDARITIIHHEKNIGLHANLEGALSVAKGTYIAISDQDDIWQLDKIEKLLAAIGDKIAVFTDSVLIDSAGASIGQTVLQSIRLKDWENCTRLLNLLYKNVVSGHAMLFHRSLLTAALPFSDDLIFDHHLALCAAICGGLVFYREPLVSHRIHGANHTNAGLAVGKDERIKTDRSQRPARREKLLQKLRIFQQLQRADLSAVRDAGFSVDAQNLQDLVEIAVTADKSVAHFFSATLMWQLYELGKKHPYYKKLNLKRCFKLARGDAWYAFFEKLGFR